MVKHRSSSLWKHIRPAIVRTGNASMTQLNVLKLDLVHPEVVP
jgi:hypothetical protein